MKDVLNRVWHEYFSDECLRVDTDEERRLLGCAADASEELNRLLTAEDRRAVERYADAIYAMQDVLIKKAFFKGCEFAVTFVIEFGLGGDATF